MSAPFRPGNPLARLLGRIVTPRRPAPGPLADYMGAGWHPNSSVDYYRPEEAGLDRLTATSIIYACVQRLGQACSSVPWRVMRRKGEEWAPEQGHDYEQAIEFPNDLMTRQHLVNLAVQHLGINGNALWRLVKVRGGTKLQHIWPMNPRVTQPVPDEQNWIKGYKPRDRPMSDENFTPYEDVVHAAIPDPDNPLWGCPPLRAVEKIVAMDREQVAWNLNATRNRMAPEYFIGLDAQNEWQLKATKDAIEERLQGPQNARKPLVVAGSGKAERISMSPVEMDWLESRRHTLLEICAAYGVPPMLFVPEAKYANLENSKRMLWEDGATWMLSMLEDALNTRLVPRQERKDTWIHYDTTNVPALKDSIEARLRSYEIAIRSMIPPRVAVALLDIPIKGDDIMRGDESLKSVALEFVEPKLTPEEQQAKDDAAAALFGSPPGRFPKPGEPIPDDEDEDEDEEQPVQ